MPMRTNWAFAEVCDAAIEIEDVAEAFKREIRALGFSYAACASHVDPLKPPAGAVMIVDYPTAWLERFSANNYARRDPVFTTARRQALPFQWSDLRYSADLDDDQIVILDEAAEVGLGNGFTIPIHAPGALPASCSLAIGPDGVDPLSVRQAHWYAVYAHETVRRLLGEGAGRKRPLLSRRERQCIELIAQGKDDFAVSVILGISEHTAHNTIRRAMRKYGVATRMQAFVRALRDGEIRLEDVAG
jgi:LuxR family transcriptional regulator, quorum-sensing system regulator BjaR1